MLGLGGESVTVLTPATVTNRYGRTTVEPTWDDPAATAVAGCLFAPQSTSEDHDGRTTVLVGARLYMPTGTAVAAADRIVIRGVTYEVDGEPSVWVDPSGGDLDGIEVQLKKVDG